MRPSILRRFYDWCAKTKIPLYLVILLSVLLSVAVWGLTSFFLETVIGQSSVRGVGVGVYWDANCDNNVAAISWGKIVIRRWEPHASKNVTVYVRNEGDSTMVLLLNASDWQPSNAKEYINLSWNYDDQFLRTKETIEVTLVLSVDSTSWLETPRIQDYSFDIVISGVSP